MQGLIQRGDIEAMRGCHGILSWNIILLQHLKERGFGGSISLFRKFPEHNVSSWTMMMSALAKDGQTWEAKSWFDWMPERTVVTWGVLLDVCGKFFGLSEVQYVFDRMPEWNIICWNVLLTAFADKGELFGAEKFFEALPERSLVSWNTMIARYGRSGMLQKAIDLFNCMLVRDTVSWNAMLIAFATNGQFNEALGFFHRMPSRDLVAENIMLSALSDERISSESLLPSAKIIFHSMCSRDIASWTSFLKLDHGDTTASRLVYYKMPAWNHVTFTTMLQVLLMNGGVLDAKFMFDSLPCRGVFSWTAMLNGFGNAGEIDAACQLFERMPNWNVVSSTSFLRLCSVEKAEETFDSMPAKNLMTWNNMLAAYVQNYIYNKARGGLKQCFEKMPGWDTVSLTSLATVYAQEGYMIEARDKLNDMEQRDTVSWNALLSLACRVGDMLRATELLHEMVLEGAKVDETTLTCVLNAFAHNGKPEEARSYFCSISEDFNLKVLLEHYCCMIDGLGRCGRLREAEELLKKMPFEVDQAASLSFVSACKTQENVLGGSEAAARFLSIQPCSSASLVLLANLQSP